MYYGEVTFISNVLKIKAYPRCHGLRPGEGGVGSGGEGGIFIVPYLL